MTLLKRDSRYIKQAEDLNSNRKAFIERNSFKTAFVKDSLWKEGDILIQDDLAENPKKNKG